ncbi:MAG: lipid IV(A) 3-deoxy-D-manno-octulosonic acid transferase [Gammaproteobacteria bacterium]|nr:lipid IV(A) 3-deoxy-D-manno-octulosonic acid transferase [Gammaproteobacteria bacterium]
MLRRLYTALFALLVPALLARLYLRSRHAGTTALRWRERLGYYREPAKGGAPIWIHAVSVGETMAAVPLVRALQEQFEDRSILLTTTTATGADTVARMLGDSVQHAFFPYDLPSAVQRFVEHFRPRILLVMETELWPNTLAVCHRRGLPIVLANARLSARSLRGYLRVAALSREIVRSIDHIAAQTSDDAARFIRLGADPQRLAVIGSLKFDLDLPASVHEQAAAVRRDLGVNRPLLMAASTREGEEALVLDAFAHITAQLPHALLLLVPRHPERFDEVAQLCASRGVRFRRRSQSAQCDEQDQVYLLDSMGELPRHYAAADVAFVGGSLLPFGGHNVLEPAVLGRPVLVGPHTFNFTEIVRLLEDAGALVVVADARALAQAALHWLRDSNERDRVGGVARDIVHRHRGATHRTVGVVRELLGVAPLSHQAVHDGSR